MEKEYPGEHVDSVTTYVNTLSPADMQLLGSLREQNIQLRRQVVQDLLTRTLENNLLALEALRADLDRTGNKDIGDVREYGRTAAGELLHGFEEAVDYDDLLGLIAEFKRGLAHRHLAS